MQEDRGCTCAASSPAAAAAADPTNTKLTPRTVQRQQCSPPPARPRATPAPACSCHAAQVPAGLIVCLDGRVLAPSRTRQRLCVCGGGQQGATQHSTAQHDGVHSMMVAGTERRCLWCGEAPTNTMGPDVLMNTIMLLGADPVQISRSEHKQAHARGAALPQPRPAHLDECGVPHPQLDARVCWGHPVGAQVHRGQQVARRGGKDGTEGACRCTCPSTAAAAAAGRSTRTE